MQMSTKTPPQPQNAVSQNMQVAEVKKKRPHLKHLTKTGRNQRLTVKQRKFVRSKIEGKSSLSAYKEAGYKTDYKTAITNAEALNRKPHIQRAIDEALELHEATPEFAVRRIKQIAEQNDQIATARLASKDILELHGWRQNDRPTVKLDINNAFFNQARQTPTE